MYDRHFNLTIHGFYEQKKKIEESRLYKALYHMPKGGIHHLHLTAACPVDFLVKLTYDEIVYFSERENMFKVFPEGVPVETGFIQVNQLRQFHKSVEQFDEELKQKILLTKDDVACQESHQIWDGFQFKFLMTNDLYNYHGFFPKVLREICRSCVAQNIYIIELRHISNFIFDDERVPIGIRAEMKVFDDVIKEFRATHPHFDIKLIDCGLKIIGKEHIQEILADTKIALKEYPDIMVAFDMVNEEDATPPILEYINELRDAKDNSVPFLLHAGETNYRKNDNLYDAILLGTKRIGHGFDIMRHPLLEKMCIDKEICLECCPLSNMILGYQLDIRNHPVKFMLSRGLPISINSDDPGFWDYDGVTLDFAWITLAWELDLKDLKKFALNAIKYSTANEEIKQLNFKHFEKQWKEYIEVLSVKY